APYHALRSRPLREAAMYQSAGSTRAGRWTPPPAAGPAPEALAVQALQRVQKAWTAYVPGMLLDPARTLAALACPFADPQQESDGEFALGWLRWLSGDNAGAEAALASFVNHIRADRAHPRLGEAAYWLARVRLLARNELAIPEYEAVLRTLGGNPQATAW